MKEDLFLNGLTSLLIDQVKSNLVKGVNMQTQQGSSNYESVGSAFPDENEYTRNFQHGQTNAKPYKKKSENEPKCYVSADA